MSPISNLFRNKEPQTQSPDGEDALRKQLREKEAELGKLKTEYEPYREYKDLFEPLQLEAFRLAKELREWLDGFGPAPAAVDTESTPASPTPEQQAISSKLAQDYESRFSERVQEVGRRFRERSAVSRNAVLEWKWVTNHRQAEEVIQGLRGVAVRMEKKEELAKVAKSSAT